MKGYLVVTLVYHVLRMYYGDGTLDHVEVTGPFAVGYKEISTSKGNFVAVFYPIEKAGGMSTSKYEQWSTWFGFIPGPRMLATAQKVFKWRHYYYPWVPQFAIKAWFGA